MSWEQRFAEIEYGGTQYEASTNPDGSVRYSKKSRYGNWYEISPDSRDPWRRWFPRGAKRLLDEQLSRENPLDGEDWLRIAVGVIAVGAIGFSFWVKSQENADAVANAAKFGVST